MFDAMESFICDHMENPMDFIEEIELEMKQLGVINKKQSMLPVVAKS